MIKRRILLFENYSNEIGYGSEASFSNDNDEPFWGNFGAGVLPYCYETERFLLNYRSADVNEPHCWGIWGGKIEDDEHIEDAVIREFEEESEYSGEINLIKAYTFENENGNFKYFNYIGIISEEFDPILDWESEDYEWVTKEELLNWDNKHFGLDRLLKDEQSLKIINKL